MTATQLVTVDELYQMGSDAPYELIGGVLYEVSLSSIRASVLGARIASAIFRYVDDQQLGFVTGARAGFILSQRPATVVAPSVGFVRGERFLDGMPDHGFCPFPPDLVVEVISPGNPKANNTEKQELYAKAGVPLVWWVDPDRKTVIVYRLGQTPEVIEATGVLDGGDVLPGFRLALQAIFQD